MTGMPDASAATAAPADAAPRAPLRVAVLGGGPTGLAAALLLAARGLSVEVIEPRALAEARRDRRLLALSAGSLQVLGAVLGGRLPPHAPIERVHVSSRGELGTTLLTPGRIGAGGQPLGATVHYGELVAALDAAVTAQPRIALRRGARASSIGQAPAEVRIVLDDGTTLVADGVVHAEGAAPGATGQPPHAAEPAGWAVLAPLTLDGAGRGDAFERFTREGPLALLPAPGPQPWSLVWCCAQAEAQRRATLDDAGFIAELQACVGTRLARVTAVGARLAVPLARAQRERLHEHRCVWLGNAAQTLHPVAGQGYNLALRDAATLADALGDPSLRGAAAALPARLARYAAQRRTDRAAIGALTRWMPDLFATRALPVAYARAAALALLDANPLARRAFAHLLMFGVRD